VKDYNDHWRPFWIHCQICSNQFDIIGKFETIKEDAEVIKDLAEFGSVRLNFPWTNR